jgi:GDP-4-dehydro-6-deoxy-D-mannose reductase
MAGAVWITGAEGFVGGWLRRELARRGVAAAALSLDPGGLAGELPCARLDLAEAAAAAPGEPVVELDGMPPPRGLVHLAALSFPPACERDPELARAVNVTGPARLYEQLLARWPELPVLHVSSGHVYLPQADPLREDQPLVPVNVYGATKLQGEAVALGLRDRGHRVSVVRPFNHTGAGQAASFALPSFALRLAALEAAGGGALEVGRLDARRDFLHVAQVVEAYLALLDHAGELGVVNVCSGTGQRIGALLDGLMSRVEAPVERRSDASRLRGAADADVLVGDPSRLAGLLGAAPQLDVEALLDELMADARRRVAAGESLDGA